MKIDNYIDWGINPFKNGFIHIKTAVESDPKKWEFSPSKEVYVKKNLNLADRVVYFAVGVILLMPLVNYVVRIAVSFFTEQNHKVKYDSLSLRPDHVGGGVLPYCVDRGEIYFLLSKEGFGSAKNTWCDFGGAKDRGEILLETAARECWEESREILGDLKEIKEKISMSAPIGENYGMYFLKVRRPKEITRDKFLERTFTDSHRMEKTDIAWAKAGDVFKAISNSNKVNSDIQLRGFFAKTLSDALKNPDEKAIIEQVYRKEGLSLDQKNGSLVWSAAKIAAGLAFGAFVYRIAS